MQELDQRLARRFMRDHPREAAKGLERLLPDEAANALAISGADAAPVLENMDRDAATACLVHYPAATRAAVLASLPADLAARLLRPLAASDREVILTACAEPVARPLRRLLRFPEGSAGAVMDPNPLSAPLDFSVADARRRLEQGADDVLYVVDRSDVLRGMLPIRELLRAAGDASLESLMFSSVPRVGARVEQEALLAHPAWNKHHLLPVVDRGDVLVGVIRYQTMRQLQGDLAAPPPAMSLGLALGEMYWTMMSALVDGVARALPARPPTDANR